MSVKVAVLRIFQAVYILILSYSILCIFDEYKYKWETYIYYLFSIIYPTHPYILVYI